MKACTELFARTCPPWAATLVVVAVVAAPPPSVGADLPFKVRVRPPAHMSIEVREQLVREILDRLKYPVVVSEGDQKLKLPPRICGKFPGETFRGVTRHRFILESPSHAQVRFAHDKIIIDLRLHCDVTYEIYHRFYRQSARRWKRTQRVRSRFIGTGTLSARPQILTVRGRQKLKLPFRCERVNLKGCPGWVEKLLGVKRRVQAYFDTAINPQAEYILPALPLPLTGKQLGAKNMTVRSDAGALRIETDFGLTDRTTP